MKSQLITMTFLVAISGQSFGQTLDINLSDTSAQFKYGNRVGGSVYGRTETSYGLLYNDDKRTVVDAGLQITDVAGSKAPGLEVGAGPKLYYVDADTRTAGAIGLGGLLRYKFPSVQRVVFMANLYYAPGIVTFMDAENLLEYNAQIGYELLPTADVYIGYRRIKVKFSDNYDEVIDKSTVFGLRFNF